MATTHTARRRQRTNPRRTSAHGRTHATRRNRAVASTNVTPPPAPVAEPPIQVVEAPVRVAAKPIRTPDADDHLAAYFRQLAEHELLTPEDERELSQGIEDTEILTWERVFARPDAVRPLLALIEPNLEQPVKFPKLQKVLDDMRSEGRRVGKEGRYRWR